MEHVDRIEAVDTFDWPPPRLVALDQRDEYFELVTLLAALRGTPAGVDRGECSAVIRIGTDGADFHSRLQSVPRHVQRIDVVVLSVRADELYKGNLPMK